MRGPCAPTSPLPAPHVAQLIRREVRVYRDEDNEWCKGVVREYNVVEDSHCVVYADGELRWCSTLLERASVCACAAAPAIQRCAAAWRAALTLIRHSSCMGGWERLRLLPTSRTLLRAARRLRAGTCSTTPTPCGCLQTRTIRPRRSSRCANSLPHLHATSPTSRLASPPPSLPRPPCRPALPPSCAPRTRFDGGDGVARRLPPFADCPVLHVAAAPLHRALSKRFRGRQRSLEDTHLTLRTSRAAAAQDVAAGQSRPHVLPLLARPRRASTREGAHATRAQVGGSMDRTRRGPTSGRTAMVRGRARGARQQPSSMTNLVEHSQALVACPMRARQSTARPTPPARRVPGCWRTHRSWRTLIHRACRTSTAWSST